MAKAVLGSNIKEKKVVSSSGLELGRVSDLHFEDGGKLLSLSVRPEKDAKAVQDYIDRTGMLVLPYESVRAIGRYVIVEFPYTK